MSIASIDLNLMLVFHTVLAERSVARAADRLHVTPSAVSNALARLRDLFGDPIVTRKGRGIVPTPRALELAPGIARAIAELEQVLLTEPFQAANCKRDFTVAMADLWQTIWAPRIAQAMQLSMPLAHLRVVGIDALISLGDLASAEVDLQLGIPPKAPGIHVDPLYSEPSELVARSGHSWFRRRKAPGALERLRHVRVDMVPSKNFGDPDATAFARKGISRNVVMTVASFSVAAEVVASSDLVTMLPTSLFVAKGRELGLRKMKVSLPTRAIPIAMCWHDRTHADPAAQAFRAIVKDVVTRS